MLDSIAASARARCADDGGLGVRGGGSHRVGGGHAHPASTMHTYQHLLPGMDVEDADDDATAGQLRLRVRLRVGEDACEPVADTV